MSRTTLSDHKLAPELVRLTADCELVKHMPLTAFASDVKKGDVDVACDARALRHSPRGRASRLGQ